MQFCTKNMFLVLCPEWHTPRPPTHNWHAYAHFLPGKCLALPLHFSLLRACISILPPGLGHVTPRVQHFPQVWPVWILMNFCKAVTRYKLALAGRGVQAWVDYCNSARCYDGSTLAFVRKIILEALYVCAEAVKQSIIHAKCGKFSKFRTSDITSVGLIFMHNTANFWVQWSPGLPDLFHHTCILSWLCSLILVLPCLLLFWRKKSSPERSWYSSLLVNCCFSFLTWCISN